MKKFKITWTELHEAEIEAESHIDARVLFKTLKDNGELDKNIKEYFMPMITEIKQDVKGEDSTD